MTKMTAMIESNPIFAEDMNTDRTSIGTIMGFSFFLKFVNILIVISCCSYFFAMSFKFLAEIQNEYFGWDNFADDSTEQPEHFTQFYNIAPDGRWGMESMIILVYFSFTSLTTVGFGDYNPRSDQERLFIAFGLLFGVAIFSLIMGNYIDIINQYNKYNASNDDGDRLTQFFGILRNFNYNEDINISLKRKIEKYFEYKWEVDKNLIINKPDYNTFFEQIPTEVIDAVYQKFLFVDFLNSYKKLFKYPKHDSPHKHAVYTWDDVEYRALMFGILNNLEPIQFEKHEIIFYELDEYSAIYFVMGGAFFQVGYTIN